MNKRFNPNLSRRDVLLGGSAAALGLTAGLQPGSVFAQDAATPVNLLVVNSTVQGELRTILEQDANVSISDAPWQSSTDAVSRVAAPGGGSSWDLVSSSFDFSKPVIMGQNAGDEKVQPIDLSLIPNLEHLTDISREAGIAERDGNTYMLPLYWGLDAVLYNHDAVPPEDDLTQSWGLLFDSKYSGRIGWWDVAHQMIMAAGLYMGHEQPEKMTREELNEVTEFLISRKPHVRTMYSTFAQGSALLTSGEIVACYGIAPMRVDLQNRGFPISGNLPKEGVLSLVLAGYIPKNAAQPEAAARVINAILDTNYASKLAGTVGYLSASKLATELTDEERERFGYGIFDGSVKNYLLKFPDDMSMWIEAWSRVKSA